MPIFEFSCNQCQHQFDVMVSNSDKFSVHCPDCGSGDIKQKLSMFSSPKAAGTSASSSVPPAPSCCAGCSKAASCGMGL